MTSLRRGAPALAVAGSIVLIALGVAGAVAPQLVLIGAVGLCAAMSLVGRSTATHR